jgi:hypothetical protein
MVTAACTLLGDKIGANAVAPEVVDKVGHIVAAINARNFTAANAVQTVSALQNILYVVL